MVATSRAVVTSAPGKVILFGEHSVNRGQIALATAIDRRVTCHVRRRDDSRFTLRSAEATDSGTMAQLRAFGAEVDALRNDGSLARLRDLASCDFFATTRYVLSRLLRDASVGVEVEWRSDLPVGAGLGSGAASSAALCLAIAELTGMSLDRGEIADHARSGDVIAHGGVASALDSCATTFGGVIRYATVGGCAPTDGFVAPRLVIADTEVRASTAEVNGSVRDLLERDAGLASVFPEMGRICDRAMAAMAAGDMELTGQLMTRNQELLRRIGVSTTQIDALCAAAIDAGAWGAKLSGSGRGGVVIALCAEDRQRDVAEAMAHAGADVMISAGGGDGVRVEDPSVWTQ